MCCFTRVIILGSGVFQAMGVYLYGELMVHEDADQQALARKCFLQAQEEMDPAVRKVVEEMIY